MALAADPEGWDPKELDRLNLGNGDELVVAGNGAASSQTAEASRDGTLLAALPREPAAAGQPAATAGPSPEEEEDAVNTAIRDALSVARYRTLVLRFEALVEQFITNSDGKELQFESDMVPYQRLLAHRVAQHHGLQTSVLSNGSGPESECRVIAIKGPDTALNPVRLAEVKVTPSSEATSTPASPSLRVLQKGLQPERARPASAAPSSSGPGGVHSAAESRSYNERKQDYQKARNRILPGEAPDNGAASPPVAVPGRSYPPTRNRPGGEGGRPGSMDGRKAVFRNREQEENDPDFQRGFHRFQQPLAPQPYGTLPPQQGMYMQRTYHGEFPALGSMPAMGAPPGHGPDGQLHQGQYGVPMQVMHPMAAAHMGMVYPHMYMPQPYFAAGMSPPGMPGMPTMPGMAMYGHVAGYGGFPMPAGYGFMPARPEGMQASHHPLGMGPQGGSPPVSGGPNRGAGQYSPQAGRGGFRGQGDRGRGRLGRTSSAASLGSAKSSSLSTAPRGPPGSPSRPGAAEGEAPAPGGV